jgi:hypothetical protein
VAIIEPGKAPVYKTYGLANIARGTPIAILLGHIGVERLFADAGSLGSVKQIDIALPSAT